MMKRRIKKFAGFEYVKDGDLSYLKFYRFYLFRKVGKDFKIL